MTITVTRTHVRTVDGVRLAVRVRSPGASPDAVHGSDVAVVVVHGFGASAECEKVDMVVGALSASGYTAVSYDARGHGASSGETTLGVLEQHDVAAAVDVAREHASRVVLVGTSMGGIAVLRHAAERHGEIAGVVTVSSPAEWRLPRNVRGVLAAVVVETAWGRSLMRSRMGVRIAPSIERGAAPLEVARSIECPVAVIHGTADPFIATRAAELLHANVPGPSQLVVVEGLAHAFDPAPRVVPAILESVDWVLDR